MEGLKKEKLGLVGIVAMIWSTFAIVAMYYRSFFGVDMTDMSYYVSEAKDIIDGNVLFAYNNSSKAVGFTVFYIIIESVYRLIIPDYEGIFLFCKLCFVTYKVIIAFCVYNIFKKRMSRSYAMILSSMLVVAEGTIPMFSYNSIPIYNLFLTGCMIYDVIELDSTKKELKMFVAGLLTGLACIANPGWGVAIIVFTVLVSLYMNRESYIPVLLCFYGAILIEIMVLLFFIIQKAGIPDLCYGVYRLFINPIPVDDLNPNKTLISVLSSFAGSLIHWVVIFLPVCLVIYFIITHKKDAQVIEKDKNAQAQKAISIGMLVIMMYSCCGNARSVNPVKLWGFYASVFFVVFIMTGFCRKEKILWYLGVYPILYVIEQLIFLSNEANIGRFVNAYTVLIPLFYTMILSKIDVVKYASIVMIMAVSITYLYIGFKHVYRDADFGDLRYCVESGIYKGNYTTECRAKDLPEMEEYLNQIIGTSETFAIRDNVPCAYLMVHHGEACDISTWDILQYSYGRNSPSVLFDYYRRRNKIPQKIIYIDYGRDDELSIMKSDFRYNKWIEEYYELVEEKRVNDTFFHVMVYQYNGSFDGNYQSWIERFWKE